MAKNSDRANVGEREADVHHRDLFEEDDEDPATELVEAVADLRGVDPNDLGPLYAWVDSLVGDLYSSPPPPDAQAVVEFSYEGYRVTLYQDGHAVFTRRSEP